uniref:Uncharacterized protein n=1 Tax=Anguilla anguilla TaxID=7936 RepID=A0A0E9X0Z0_ANGAN
MIDVVVYPFPLLITFQSKGRGSFYPENDQLFLTMWISIFSCHIFLFLILFSETYAFTI